MSDADLAGIGLTTGVKKVLALLAGGDKKSKTPRVKSVAKPKDKAVKAAGAKGTVRKRVGEEVGEVEGEDKLAAKLRKMDQK